jgi:cystathionine beta-synthase
LKEADGAAAQGDSKPQSVPKRKFVQITMDTTLASLSKFFEWNSAAIVTEKGSAETAGLPKPVAVVTKVDLVSWMMKQSAV